MRPERLDLLVERLFAGATAPLKEPRRLFAFVDGARSDRAGEALATCPTRHECLPGDVTDPGLKATFPWLVELDREAAWTRNLLDWAWGDNVVSFVEATAGFDRVIFHFRSVLVLDAPPPDSFSGLVRIADWLDANSHAELAQTVREEIDAMAPKTIVRAWDPRVLRPLMETGDPLPARRLSGPVLRFLCESDGGAALLAWTRRGDAFVPETIGIE
jgi:hypothetical protein